MSVKINLTPDESTAIKVQHQKLTPEKVCFQNASTTFFDTSLYHEVTVTGQWICINAEVFSSHYISVCRISKNKYAVVFAIDYMDTLTVRAYSLHELEVHFTSKNRPEYWFGPEMEKADEYIAKLDIASYD